MKDLMVTMRCGGLEVSASSDEGLSLDFVSHHSGEECWDNVADGSDVLDVLAEMLEFAREHVAQGKKPERKAKP